MGRKRIQTLEERQFEMKRELERRKKDREIEKKSGVYDEENRLVSDKAMILNKYGIETGRALEIVESIVEFTKKIWGLDK